jgi:hypothetical protein
VKNVNNSVDLIYPKIIRLGQKHDPQSGKLHISVKKKDAQFAVPK